MIKRKGLMLIGCALMTLGLASCGGNTPTIPNDDDFSQSDVEGEKTVFSMVGAGEKFANWDPAASVKNESLVLKEEGDFFVATIEVTNEDVFKIVSNGAWNGGNQYGAEDLDKAKSTAGIIPEKEYTGGPTNRSNLEIQKTGTLTVKLNPYYFINKLTESALVLTIK